MRKLLLLGGMALLLTSCLKDKSTLDFAEHEEISVGGIESKYTIVSGVEKITISPEVASTDPNAEYEYLWGLYETNVQGSAPVLDTLARTKEIDYPLTRPAKDWVLVYRVTNKNTGYSTYINSTISVVTPFTRGWYVLKSEGEQSDLDMFSTPEEIAPTSQVDNVFSANNKGRKLQGKGAYLTFFSSYKSNVVDASMFANTRALAIVSDKDISIVNTNDLNEIRNLNTIYFQAPVLKAPKFMIIGPQAIFINNGGGVASLYSMSANTGQFGTNKLIDQSKTPYRISKYALTNWLIGAPYFYDELSTSFYNADGSGTYFIKVADHADTEMSANNTNKDLLWMGLKNYYPIQGYAMFQDKTDPSLKILSHITPSNAAFKIINDTLSTSDKLYNAEKYATLDGDEAMMYFSIGNVIWSRNLANGFEQIQYTLPAGEQVAFLKHRKAPGSTPAYAFNFVVVGTKEGANYKVRMFNKTSGNLSTEPVFVLEGAGEVADVMYIAPNISETTYNNYL